MTEKFSGFSIGRASKAEGAHDAFEQLVKLYNDLKDPAYKEKYAAIINDARERVKKARIKENQMRNPSVQPVSLRHCAS